MELYPARRTSFCLLAGVRSRKWKLSLSLNCFKPLIKLLVPELLDLSILFSFDILFFSEHPLLVNQCSLLCSSIRHGFKTIILTTCSTCSTKILLDNNNNNNNNNL